MSGERRVLNDVGGVLADIVDGLHDVSRQLEGLPHALVGGVAVLVHVQGHRVTQDIDSAVRAFEVDVRQRLQVVADVELTKDSDGSSSSERGAGRRPGSRPQPTAPRDRGAQGLASGLSGPGLEPLVPYGSLKPAERRAVHERLAEDRQLLLVATDRYIGEGFDCPKLDTLFLAFPISARERITQYVGRILRDQAGKDVAEVHDYLDADVPMLAAMYRRRRPGYKQLGFTPGSPQAASLATTRVRRIRSETSIW